MEGFDWQTGAVAVLAVFLLGGGLCWRIFGPRPAARVPKPPKPSNKEKNRQRKDRRRQEQDDAHARLQAELDKCRQRLGVPTVSGSTVEEAVRKDPEAAAKAVRLMMKQD